MACWLKKTVDDKAGDECETLGQHRVWSGLESAAPSAECMNYGCQEGFSGRETDNFGVEDELAHLTTLYFCVLWMLEKDAQCKGPSIFKGERSSLAV